MAEEEDTKTEEQQGAEAKKGGKSPKGKGKGPAGPAGPAPIKGKSKGKEASAPEWQKPNISSEWQVERMVHWQPIRQTNRLEGSVWQQVHDSLDGKATRENQLPDQVLERFMRKSEEVPQKKRSSEVGKKKVAGQSQRILTSKDALAADIHYEMLKRKNITAEDLTWLVGPAKGDEKVLEEEVLEGLQGLFAAAAQEASWERGLREAEASVPSEVLLRRLLQRATLHDLQLRVRLNLDMARFNPKAKDLESALDLVLTAAWTIIDSTAMPVLLEGVLLLGNSVNAASKNLGGAVGVTLESLTKLGHTQCLPAKQAAGKKSKSSSRKENALEVLALHLEKANHGFISNLNSDLNACHAAKDFDHKLMADLVKELAEQVKEVHKEARLDQSQVPCLEAQRLRDFVSTADAQVQHLQTCLEEVEEATVSLRQWFAEPTSSSLGSMLKMLADLRGLAIPRQCEVLPPRDYRESSTRKRRLEEKKIKKTKAAEEATPATEATEAKVPEVVKEEKPVDEAPSQSVLGFGEAAPYGALSQILSMSQGTICILWSFDWTNVQQSFADASEKICAFEVLQFSSDFATLSQAELNAELAVFRWRCPTCPLKTDLPVECHYVFAVRAILLKPSGCLDEAEMLWASSLSSPVIVDLRYSSGSFGMGSMGCSAGDQETSPSERWPTSQIAEKKLASRNVSSSPRQRGASGPVAKSIGEFLSSGGSPSRRPSLRPPNQSLESEKSPRSLEVPGQLERLPETSQAQPPEASKTHTANPQDTSATALEPGNAITVSIGQATAPAPEAPGELSPSSCSHQDLNVLDDASLLRLARSYSVPKRTAASSSRPETFDRGDALHEPMPKESMAELSSPDVPKSQGKLNVPRVASIFDDDDTRARMALRLSMEDLEPVQEHSPGQLKSSGSSEILDGQEVHAQMERLFKSVQKCKQCNGTGYVGLFGAQGLGLWQSKCRSCSK